MSAVIPLLLHEEKQVVGAALEDVFGLQLLQVGSWGEPGELLTEARTQRQTVIVGETKEPGDAVARSGQLPVADESVDAVLLPHTLERASDPYAVLREAERVLVGEGKLLIMGFNPWGGWGLRHRLSRWRTGVGFPPGAERVISEWRLRDWLAVLSFEVTSVRRYLFQLPVTGAREHRWMLPAGAYLLKAVKRVYTLTPTRPRWKDKRALVGGLVEPSTGRMIHRRQQPIIPSPRP